MYTPSFNRVDDPAILRAFIHAHGFATLITQGGGALRASHLPILLAESPDGDSLRGHMARANEQWRFFAPDQEALCIFHGPHSYISPSWYEAKVAVPTWNYAAVHVHGVPRLEADPALLRKIVEDTTIKYESGMETPWKLDGLPEDYMTAMTKAIVGFSVRITRIEGKFKFGQNRSPEDQAKMLRSLEASPNPESRILAAFVRENGGPGGKPRSPAAAPA